MVRTFAALLLLSLVGLAQDAATLIEHGHMKRAKTVLDQRLKANPNDAEALTLMSRYKLATNDVEGAINLADKAVQLAPTSPDAWVQVARAKGTKAQRASVFSQMGLARDVRKAGEKAVELSPNHRDALAFMIVFHREAPGIVGGDKNKMAEYINRLLKVDPVEGNLILAQNAANAKEFDKLEGYYKMAVKADPKDYLAQLNLGGFYANYEKGRNYPLAEQHVREAMKIDPTRAQAWGTLAALLALQKKWPEVEALVNDSKKRLPGNLNPQFQAARIMVQTGENFPLAERYLHEYLKEQPEPNAAGHEAAHWRLGLLYEKQNRKAEAIAHMRTALRLKPDFEPAKKDLKRLGG